MHFLQVKFWLFENFLSPTFKDSAAAMAKEAGFEVGYVTYKWPEWLRQQTEKQRIIWGYKILFLDVLFPLSVKKVIYVDADQVVRADLRELWELDLGEVSRHAPFCDSREETLGYQFWRSGFWADHLRGRPYHISRCRRGTSAPSANMVGDQLLVGVRLAEPRPELAGQPGPGPAQLRAARHPHPLPPPGVAVV
ncbi:unnamed protein product [Heterosigma akashiwo]